MGPRLRSLPILALFLAAVDTLGVRMVLRHRPTEPLLFGEAWLLWLAIGALALVPASLAAWFFGRVRGARSAEPERTRGLRQALGLCAWMVFPVLAHAVLDRHTDLGGDLSGLARLRPWLELAGGVALCAALAWSILRVGRRVPASALGLAVALVSIPVGLFVGFHGGGPSQAERATAAGGERPNLLLVVWDTTRAASLSPWGYGRGTTPKLERLSADSLVFENARSASRYTLTSHLSMLTGVYPSDHGARMRRQEFNPRRTPSVVEALRADGYRTAGFMGTGVLRAQTGIGYGFEVWDDQVDPLVCDTRAWALVHDLQSILAKLGPPFSRDGHPHWIQDFARPAGVVLERAARWIESHDPRPWFCMINLYDVHWPYLPGEEAREKWVRPYDGSIDGYLFRSDRYVRGTKPDARDDAHLAELYDAEMWELDRAVGAFLERVGLDERRVALVIASDHGEAFGEGGRYEHDDILEVQLHVPLLVRPPGGAQEGRAALARELPVSGVDIAPTLLALAGLPAEEHHIGLSLLGAAPEEGSERLILVEDRDHMDPADVRLALYRGRWKLVRLGLGTGQRFRLYDLASDPRGLTDVAAEQPEVLAELKGDMEELRARWDADDLKDARTGGDQNRDALRALGYTGE